MKSLAEKYQCLEDDGNHLEYHLLITNSLVSDRINFSRSGRVVVQDIYRQLLVQNLQHNELIDYVIHQLLKFKQDNRIVKGYELGSGADVDAKICNKMNSFHVNFLKSAAWKLVHLKIGHEEFIKLILFCNCFLKVECNGVKNFVQLFGESYQVYNYMSKNPYISKNRMLYKEEYQLKRMNPLPDNRIHILRNMFPSFFKDKDHITNIPKKFKKLHKLLAKVIANHKSCNYPYIVDNICPTTLINFKEKDIRSVGTDYKIVIEFVICIIDKVFPLEIFGTKYNKSIILGKIAKFLTASRLQKFAKNTLINDVKLTDIDWLATTKGKLNKQDFNKRKLLLQDFLTWLLLYFVSKLVACFFHVTETSSGTLLFYRHHLWAKITKPFMDRYFAKYLDSNSGDPPTRSFVECDKIQGKMRLIPKSKDFRVINVPFRGNKDENFQYWNYLNNEIKPVRSILFQGRNSKKYSDSYCYSVSDIPRQISKYQKQVISTSDKRQEFYYIKFDAKSCYDSIPKEKVKECAKKLIPQGEIFIYRQISAGGGLAKFRNSTLLVGLDEILKLDIISNGTDFFKNKFLLDQTKTIVLNSEQVMNIIDLQLDNTVVQVKRKCYARTNGIFQGFPLSAIFCDIVYDELVETYMQYILDDVESILLRVADDFMVISTNPDQIRKVLYQTQQGFGDFHVKINNDKTKFKLKPHGNDEVVFCGLTIDMKDLNVFKHADSYGSMIFNGKSFKELYAKLVWLCKTRISNNIIKANDANCMEINLVNSLHILKNIIQLFIQHHKQIEDKFNELKFIIFCNEIINVIWKWIKLDNHECNKIWYDTVKQECVQVVIEVMMNENF